MPRLTVGDIWSRKVQSRAGMQWRRVASVNWRLLIELEADTVLLSRTSKYSSVLSLILQLCYWNATRKCGRGISYRVSQVRILFLTHCSYVLLFTSAVVITRTACLGAFGELRKPTICFVMSVRPPVCLSVRPSLRPHGTQLGYHWTDFHGIRFLCIFRKSVGNIQVSLKSDKNNGYFMWISMYIYDNTSLTS
jgi:hypothetical protein